MLQLIPLCIRHRLYAALVHIFTRALLDYQTPAALLLVAAAAAAEAEAAAAAAEGAGTAAELLAARESLRLGYKLLIFLRCCLLGQAYPPGGVDGWAGGTRPAGGQGSTQALQQACCTPDTRRPHECPAFACLRSPPAHPPHCNRLIDWPGTGAAPAEQQQRAKAQALAFLLYSSGLSGGWVGQRCCAADTLMMLGAAGAAVPPSGGPGSDPGLPRWHAEWVWPLSARSGHADSRPAGCDCALGRGGANGAFSFLPAVWECWRLWGEVAHSQESAAVQQLPLGIHVGAAALLLHLSAQPAPPAFVGAAACSWLLCFLPGRCVMQQMALSCLYLRACCLDAVQPWWQTAGTPCASCRTPTPRCATFAAWMPPPCWACWGRPWMAGTPWKQVRAVGLLRWQHIGAGVPGAGVAWTKRGSAPVGGEAPLMLGVTQQALHVPDLAEVVPLHRADLAEVAPDIGSQLATHGGARTVAQVRRRGCPQACSHGLQGRGIRSVHCGDGGV